MRLIIPVDSRVSDAAALLFLDTDRNQFEAVVIETGGLRQRNGFRGACFVEDRVFACTSSQVLEMEVAWPVGGRPSARVIRRIRRPEWLMDAAANADLHSLYYDTSTTMLLVANSKMDCVDYIDATGKLADRRYLWDINDELMELGLQRRPGLHDLCHLNHFAKIGDEVVLTLANLNGTRSGVLMSLSTGEILARDLAFPHDGALTGNRFVVSESDTRKLVVFEGVKAAADLKSASRRTIDTLTSHETNEGGRLWIRGLAAQGDRLLVGCSQFDDRGEDRRGLPSHLRLFDLASGTLQAKVFLPAAEGVIRPVLYTVMGVDGELATSDLSHWGRPFVHYGWRTLFDISAGGVRSESATPVFVSPTTCPVQAEIDAQGLVIRSDLEPGANATVRFDRGPIASPPSEPERWALGPRDPLRLRWRLSGQEGELALTFIVTAYADHALETRRFKAEPESSGAEFTLPEETRTFRLTVRASGNGRAVVERLTLEQEIALPGRADTELPAVSVTAADAYRQGQAALRDGDVQRACDALGVAVAGASDRPGWRITYARALFRADRLTEAEEQARLATDADARHATWHSFYASICEKMGRLEEAVLALEASISLSGADGRSHFRLARLLAALNRREAAVASARAAVALAPNWEWFAFLSALERQEGNLPAALAAAEAVLEHAPKPTVKMQAAVADLKARLVRGGSLKEATPEYYERIYRYTDEAQLAAEAFIYLPAWKRIVGRLEELKARQVLDLGCGPGEFAAFLMPRRPDLGYTGIDASAAAVERARARCPLGNFEQADAQTSDLLRDPRFDVVICTEMLEHIEDDLGLLSRLRPGTAFVGSVPDFDSFGHVRHFRSIEEVRQRYGNSFRSLQIEEVTLSPTARLFLLFGIAGNDGVRLEAVSTQTAYEVHRLADPELTFTRFFWDRELARVRDGKVHASIGPRLLSGGAWEQAGERWFSFYRDLLGINPEHRLLDYGCGSLRIGSHFIRHLSRGGYFGMDILPDLIEMGKSMTGTELIHDRAPHLELICEASLSEAANFAADFVISTAVAYHVPPEEKVGYCRNLSTLAHKPGAAVALDVKLADVALQYNSSGWAWPLESYKAALSPLEFVAVHRQRAYRFDPRCTVAILEFRRT